MAANSEDLLERLSKAVDLVEWIHTQIDELCVPADLRTRLSCAAYAICMEHHASIIWLLMHDLNASAFAILRLEFEAYVRASWMRECATGLWFKKFASDSEFPKIGTLVEQLERTEMFREKVISVFKENSWSNLCSYTHTGSLQIQRWITESSISPNYSDPEIAEAISCANAFGLLAAVGTSRLADDSELGLRLLERARLESVVI